MSAKTDWQGWQGDSPRKFGKKARRWFAAAVRARLSPHAASHMVSVDALVEWCVERADQYVRWVPADEYRGGNYADGAWEIDWGHLLNDTASCAESDIQRAADAAAFPTLDEWLRADCDGRLTYPGELGGTVSIEPALYERTIQAAEARRAREARP